MFRELRSKSDLFKYYTGEEKLFADSETFLINLPTLPEIKKKEDKKDRKIVYTSPRPPLIMDVDKVVSSIIAPICYDWLKLPYPIVWQFNSYLGYDKTISMMNYESIISFSSLVKRYIGKKYIKYPNVLIRRDIEELLIIPVLGKFWKYLYPSHQLSEYLSLFSDKDWRNNVYDDTIHLLMDLILSIKG